MEQGSGLDPLTKYMSFHIVGVEEIMLHKLYKFLLQHQVILALFLIATGWLIFQTRGILASLFISYIIMAALMPATTFLRKNGFPNIAAVLLPYLGTILFLFLIIFPLFPFLVGQVKSLASDLPVYLDESAEVVGFTINEEQIQGVIGREIDGIGRNAFTLTSRVFGSVFTTLTVLIIGFYMLLYHESFKRSIARLFHKDEEERVLTTLEQINQKLGAWLRGQLALSLFIGGLTYIVLSLIGLPFALPLALIAGILEIVPTLGPILASIPAVIVAFTISPSTALAVGIIYIIIQLIENNFLVPKIMQKAVGLNPVVVIVGVMIGGNLMGIAGALLSVPFISFLIVIFNAINEED